ncbi:penicillin acylase family protein [Elongatibacter sediminis]|uniref:Penicillin acylase family protein n=1 Tax=Elongatibacter sediminis TaxID=3119006 RepID=A0AAW9R7F9_9GAMM
MARIPRFSWYLKVPSAVAVLIFVLFAVPAQAADFNLPGLSGPVTVYEDALGIPTIRGDNESDVVFVLGYLHARDRMFQMDRDRKGAAGRAAELLGSAALSSDVQFRNLGLERAALDTWQVLGDETKGILQSYANGVNAWLAANPLPPEYTALELTRTDPWTPLDTLLVAKGLGAGFSLGFGDVDNTVALGTYQAFGDALGFDGVALFFEDTYRVQPPDDRLTAPGFLAGIGGVGQASVETAGTDGGKAESGITVSGDQRVPDTMLNLAARYRATLDAAPGVEARLQSAEMLKGSNAWVVSGEHTASGYPLIANDPHLTMDTPPIFHEAQMIYDRGDGQDWHVNGTVVPGTPGVLLGCNNHACWGMTVNPLDVTDFFFETLQTNALGLPTHTVYKGEPEMIRQEFNSYFVNPVGDGIADNIEKANVGYTAGAISLIVPRRNNGPIVDIDGNTGLSVAYTGFGPTREVDLIRGIDQADSLESFAESLEFFDIGVQNVYYADVLGNIAWFATSEHPIREDLASLTVDGLPPWFIRDGTGAQANEWLPVMNPQPNQSLPFEILPMAEMPHLINPEQGFITNANNDPIGTNLDNDPLNQLRPDFNGIYYLNAGYAAYRMGRVDREVKSLVARGGVDVQDFIDLQANVQLLDAELILPILLAQFDGAPPGSPMAQALDVLSTWDYSAPTGLAEGWDQGDDPVMASTPDTTEIRNSAAATVFALWRSMLVRNTIDATLTAIGLGNELPPSRVAYNAFKHHLLNYPTAGGVGASGINFFSAGLAATVQASLQQALDLLASEEFAPAFAGSQNVMDYRWGKLHRIVFDSTLDTDPFDIPNGGGFMDLSPELPGLARQGGYEAVDASSHSARANTLNGFMFGHGPSRRFIGHMAPGGAEALQVIPGGQSGVFFDPNFASQLPLWLTNDYHDLAQGQADAVASAQSISTFGPAN